MSLLLETMFGDETFDTGSAKVQLFAVPTKLHNSFKSECHIDFAARKEEVPVSLHNKAGQFNAYNETYRDDLGKWTQAVYRVNEGMIFKIFARRAGMHGQRITNASQFIRIRAGAAYREIKVRLTGHPKARFQYAVIKGNFDVLDIEAARKFGAHVPATFQHTFNPQDVARIMEFKILAEETETATIVRERVFKRGGETVIVQKVKKARALDLDEE